MSYVHETPFKIWLKKYWILLHFIYQSFKLGMFTNIVLQNCKISKKTTKYKNQNQNLEHLSDNGHSTHTSHERSQSTVKSNSEKMGWTLLGFDLRCRLWTALRLSQTNSSYYKISTCLSNSSNQELWPLQAQVTVNVLELQRLTKINPGRVGDEKPTKIWSLGDHLKG